MVEEYINLQGDGFAKIQLADYYGKNPNSKSLIT